MIRTNAAGLLRRGCRDLLAIGGSVVLGTLLLVACGDPPPPKQTSPDQTPKVEQRGLRPRTMEKSAKIGSTAATAATQDSTDTSSAPSFIRIAAGEDHACALQTSGRIQCWGANDEGQLDAPEGVAFQEVTAGYRFTCGIRTDGGISCWGRNNHAQLNAPDGQFTAVDAGWDHVCALSGTTATCWGWNANERATPPPSAAYSVIGAGAEHSCGLTSTSDLVCWGRNDDGRAQSRQGPFRALAVGIAHTCVLRNDGSALCQGESAGSDTVAPNSAFSQISAGMDQICGLDFNGVVECWGITQDESTSGSLPTPTGPFTAINLGWTNACAVTQDGLAQCWQYPAPTPPPPPYDRLNLLNVTPGHLFSQPTDVVAWPAGGLAVADRTGFISNFVSGSDPRIVLDLRDIVVATGSLNGLLSILVDPEFEDSPFIYVYYTVKENTEVGKETALLSRFRISDNRAVREDQLTILEIPILPRPNYGYERSSHYGGAIRFGADGMLYMGIGDSYCFKCPQTLDTLHGKIIRIDVRGASAEQPYRVPDDNPFVSSSGARPEIWAFGLRNPWRMAFDPQDGRLWVSDLGHDGEDEVSIAVAGANLGWPIFEGSRCLKIDQSTIENYGADIVSHGCDDTSDAIFPTITHSLIGDRCALIGGFVYRGSSIAWLGGAYLFGDFCSGQIWAHVSDKNTASWQLIEIANLPQPISSFGVDAAGEVYVVTFGGPILQLVEFESGFIPTTTIVPSETFEPPEDQDQ